MKITDVKAIWIYMPLEKPFHGGTYTIDSRATIVTRIFTDEDIVGEAFGGDQRFNGREICNLIEGDFKKISLRSVQKIFCVSG